jgi:hypothetical protein
MTISCRAGSTVEGCGPAVRSDGEAAGVQAATVASTSAAPTARGAGGGVRRAVLADIREPARGDAARPPAALARRELDAEGRPESRRRNREPSAEAAIAPLVEPFIVPLTISRASATLAASVAHPSGLPHPLERARPLRSTTPLAVIGARRGIGRDERITLKVDSTTRGAIRKLYRSETVWAARGGTPASSNGCRAGGRDGSMWSADLHGSSDRGRRATTGSSDAASSRRGGWTRGAPPRRRVSDPRHVGRGLSAVEPVGA